MRRRTQILEEVWPLKKPFIISRGVRTETRTIKVIIEEGAVRGVGGAVASPRYGETEGSVIEQIKSVETMIRDGLTRERLQSVLPAGAARNAVDAALWDLQAKLSKQDVGALSRLGWPNHIITVQTISILSPTEMATEAARLNRFPVLKVKLNEELVIDRVRAVHESAPRSKLLIDANESWSLETLQKVAPQLSELGVVMIEQPLAAHSDEPLRGYQCPLPLYADESCHTRADLELLSGKYDGINIKLDKTGGLTEAILLKDMAESRGFQIMVGCMLGSSLGIAPAMFVANSALYVDLDAPALLAKDHNPSLTINNGMLSSLPGALWGGVE